MGRFLNSVTYENDFTFIANDTYFVDKSGIIEHFNNLIKTSRRFVCITRPRRFGKSINASMLATYYSNNLDSKEIFDKLNIHTVASYEKHLNKHNVIYISFNTNNSKFETYNDYISYFESRLAKDLKSFYPDLEEDIFIPDMFDEIYKSTGEGFIFIFDEWDYIFNNNMYSKNDRQNFLKFLESLLKGQSYVEFAYMTGVLPIAKYSSGSTLNNFDEYNILRGTTYDKYFGFTQGEVECLCSKQDVISMDELKEWYNGYYTKSGLKVYNPRSVIAALSSGECENYWTNTGSMNEIAFYIQNDILDVKKDIVDMISGNFVAIKLHGYSAEQGELNTRNKILSAMTILGFLSYYNNQVSIPNKELLQKFQAVLEEQVMGNVAKIVAMSDRMLKATTAQNTELMEQLIEEAHAMYLTFFNYNDENSLTCLINLIYLSAHNYYNISREDVAGLGRADFIFYPLNPSDTAFILELKVDDTPDNAIQQIMDKKYYVKLNQYAGKKLAIGISYYKDRDNKKHSVKIVEI